MEVYLHMVNLLNFLFNRVLFVSFISYDTLNKVCMYVTCTLLIIYIMGGGGWYLLPFMTYMGRPGSKGYLF